MQLINNVKQILKKEADQQAKLNQLTKLLNENETSFEEKSPQKSEDQ